MTGAVRGRLWAPAAGRLALVRSGSMERPRQTALAGIQRAKGTRQGALCWPPPREGCGWGAAVGGGGMWGRRACKQKVEWRDRRPCRRLTCSFGTTTTALPYGCTPASPVPHGATRLRRAFGYQTVAQRSATSGNQTTHGQLKVRLLVASLRLVRCRGDLQSRDLAVAAVSQLQPEAAGASRGCGTRTRGRRATVSCALWPFLEPWPLPRSFSSLCRGGCAAPCARRTQHLQDLQATAVSVTQLLPIQ